MERNARFKESRRKKRIEFIPVEPHPKGIFYWLIATISLRCFPLQLSFSVYSVSPPVVHRFFKADPDYDL